MIKTDFFENYASRLQAVISGYNWEPVSKLASALKTAWREKRRVFICGNGGSAGNAIHLANDFLYGISKSDGKGIRVSALPANPAVLTCLANDISYEDIFSQQLVIQADAGDLLIVLSGSGNSPNVVKDLTIAKELDMQSFAILGYSGGKCLELADVSIHFKVDDMQLSEDLHLVVGHMLMQRLSQNSLGQ